MRNIKEHLVIDGRVSARSIRNEVADKVKLIRNGGNDVSLAVVQVGHDGASDVYIRNKQKACEEVGIKFKLYHLEESVQESEIMNLILQLNDDPFVTGIMVQLPLPEHIDVQHIMSVINPVKDVDAFNPTDVGLLHNDYWTMAPCTPYGIMKLLDANDVDVAGKHCVVVGRSDIVGKPMAAMLLNEDATVTVCHSKTANLKDICKSSDILIVAIGKAKYITADYVKEGAVVIDVGMNRDENGKLCGDVDMDSVMSIVGMITPVPGGVGPMTVATLLENCVTAHELQRSYRQLVADMKANGNKF